MNFLLLSKSALAVVLLASGAVFAEAAETPPSPVVSPLSLSGALQVLLGLLVVLAAIGVTVWLLKRFPIGQQAMGGLVKVVGGVALGPRERLILVEVGDTWLLLGVAPGQINTLHTLPRPAEAPKIESLPQPAFASWLKQALHKREAK